MSSLEKVSPGINPLFFSQKIDAKEPEKKIPSTAAKATTRSPIKKRLIVISHRKLARINTQKLQIDQWTASSKEDGEVSAQVCYSLSLKAITVKVCKHERK